MDTTATFASLLRQTRIARDLTQETLAEAVGCATQTIRSFEIGRRRPSREMAARLADVLELAAPERDLLVRLARVPLTQRPAESLPDANLVPPPAATQPARLALPLPADALIGRHAELERLRQALLAEHRRLTTLLGPGGIGKTRLAQQTAADLATHFADGATCVALAPVVDAANVAIAIATSVGCPLSGAPQPEAALLEFLRDRDLLLVLDNLEHLLGPEQGEKTGGLIAAILEAAPGVRLLVTSRERLRLRDEWVIEVGGLTLPDERPSAHVERSSAVLLFLERARQVSAEFALTPRNRGDVARVCRLLGGVPLAIELAASWVRVLSCEEIAAEVERGADFLSVANRDMPVRHRSLRAVLDHSWQLLAAEERHLLAHMSVFSGGCRREAITAVLGQAGGAARVLPLLAALVDKSLLRRSNDADGTTRYDMHEFVRQYAAARLAEDPADASATEARHAAFYSVWLADQERVLKSAQQKAAVSAIIAEIANVRTAWQWSCAHQDARALYRMTPTLDWFYEVRGWYVEAAPAFAQGMQAIKPLAFAPDADEATQVCYWLLFGREGFHMLRRDPVFAVARLRDSVAELRRASGHGEQIHCIKGLAYVNMFAGNYVEAQALLDEAREVSIARGDNWNLAMVLVIRGALEVLRSEARTAQQHLDEALVVAREVGDPRPISTALVYKSLIALSLGAPNEAERGCREALVLAAGQQDRFQMSLGLQVLGRIALAKNDHAEAEWLLNESLSIARDISDRWLEAQALGCLGSLATRRGDRARARERHRAAVATAARAPQPIALDELLALALLELDEQPHASLTALAYVRHHPLARPATRATAEAHWQERRLAAEPAQLEAAERAAQARPHDRPTALLDLFPS